MKAEADGWRDFQHQFMQLANEEERTPGPQRQLKIDLGAIVSVEQIKVNKDHLNPVYHEHGLRSLKELVRSYLTITKISDGSCRE